MKQEGDWSMKENVIAIVRGCTEGSDRGDLAFPQVVEKLMAAGVERYRADLVRAEKTYYLPSGESAVIASKSVRRAPATTFTATGVEAAVRDAQARRIGYGEFCERIAEAGCVDYVVSLAGRRAVYSGRTGESHVELFPSGR